jgi:uncharacterized protein (TIGR04222 family)
MNSEHIELYERIHAFSLDQPEVRFSFSQRLAKENGWSLAYAQQAIAEYKKFAFLAVAAGHPVTPSEAVDQVWHLHLTYTRSYWQEFCPKVLQTPLHHNPTQGGASERVMFIEQYSKTLDSYQQFFGHTPPREIWSTPSDRFGRDLQHVRVNTQQTWLLPKPSLRQLPKVDVLKLHFFRVTLPKVTLPHPALLLLLVGVVSALTGCQSADTTLNPLDFAGPEFLTFYFLLSVVFVFLASRLRNYLRLPGGNLIRQRPVSLDVYETAYLADGKNRVVDTAIASLVQTQSVVVESAQRSFTLQKPLTEISHPVERAVAEAIANNGRIDVVRQGSFQAINAIFGRLQQLELLITPQRSMTARIVPALLFVALLGLGIAKILVGISRGKPVGYLVMMCVVVAIVGICFLLIPIHRSRYGDRVLKDLRTRIQSIVFSPSHPQLALAFALLGVWILPVDDIFADLRTVLAPVSTGGGGDGGSGGCSGGDGGGGCGGGCGGCGGGCGG